MENKSEGEKLNEDEAHWDSVAVKMDGKVFDTELCMKNGSHRPCELKDHLLQPI